jgi:hypothetical protein
MLDVRRDTTRHVESLCEVLSGLQLLVLCRAVGVIIDCHCVAVGI